MDAPLKQRLIGAAVLVALAVIFLPMLVSGPDPQSGTSGVPLDIPPPPERNFETRDLPLAPPSSATPAAAEQADDPNRIVTVDADAVPRVDALPEAPDASTPTPDAETTAPANAPEIAIATPEPAPATAAAPATTPGGRFVVNLGSYGNAANAVALVTAMKGAGLAAYAESTVHDDKPVQRVRIGPYAQRGEAEAARLAATRVRADLPAAVVALETDSTAATPAPAPARAPVASGFAVQLGALKSAADANALRDRARAAGFVAFVERADTEAGPLWRVRAGPELHRANADRLKASIAQKLGIDAVVVTHP